MSKVSTTTGTNSNNRGATSPLNTPTPLSDDDFVMMCLFGDGSLEDAIHALYYLPPQFKLRVLINAASARLPFAGHDAVKNRISLETETGVLLKQSPFSTANAVVYSEATPVKSESATPRVVISKAAHTSMRNTGNTFTITESNPEALASAVLRIAKTAA